ncbi:MAG TPA: class II aldolase/adducin family protein, partial [Trueperaceae bacterium]|nr:class II aldolase/adducin family protein [Trueperaceae bacterium]
LSFRSADDELVISASGAKLDELAPADLVACSISGAELKGAGGRPSKELPLHRAVYRARPGAQAVLHAAPFHATLAACSDIDVPDGLFVEAMYYLERVARVPYQHPGSEALGAAVGEHARWADVLLLENHGVVVLDESLDEALQALQVLELASRMVLGAKAAGITLRPLPPETANDFRTRSAYKPRRSWPEEGPT